MPEMMQRWTIDALGRESLRLTNTEVPEPGPGEVLAKVAAVSLNYRDKLMIETGMGVPLAFPFTPASDMAGTVAATGEGVDRFKVGDRVISNFMPGWIDGRGAGNARVPSYRTLGGELPGVLAEYVAFPQDWFSRAPESLDDGEASTLPVAGLTAWFALVERGGVRAGQTVVVQGTGGVALLASRSPDFTGPRSSSPLEATRSSHVQRLLARRTGSIATTEAGLRRCIV